MPQVVEFSIGASSRRVIALPAENENVPEWVWRPVRRASARPHGVIHIAELEDVRIRDISPRLIDVY